VKQKLSELVSAFLTETGRLLF